MGVSTAVCLAFSIVEPFRHTPLQQRTPSSLPLYHVPNTLQPALLYRPQSSLRASSSSSNNKTKPPPLPAIDDPYILLGLDSRNPTTDKKEIKRAYRKQAMKYHPDVRLTPDSTNNEKDEASKDFARINAAYEMLTGGGKGSVGADTKTSSGGYNYQPPHRRTSDYSSSSSYGKSTSWEDFMPNYNDEDAKYDAEGDSFGSIFSDVLSGAAGYAAGYGGGGIVTDFIEFLEQNVDGLDSSGFNDDNLLINGSFDEVASEMDETDILVTSLETKLSTIENELMQVKADLNTATKFSEKLDLEERVAELKAREGVVKGYLKKGKKRLIKLRERYKELIVQGRGGRGYRGSSSSNGNSASESRSYSSRGGSSSSSSSNTYSRATEPTPPASSSTESAKSSPVSAPSSSSSSSSWRNEGFSSSYGRRSSSSRSSSGRRSRSTYDSSSPRREKEVEQQQQNQSSNQQQSPSEDTGYRTSSSGSSSNSNSSSSKKSTPQQYEPWVPPHRRTTSTTERAAQDKRRLRELKVDDDFDKLKREMGL